MEFKDLKKAIQAQFKKMEKEAALFRVDIEGDDLYAHYLASFPEGLNPMFRERTVHDCSSCKSFIRQFGGIVAIINNEVVSIWDCQVGGDYQVVADAMSAKVKSAPVENIFLNTFPKLGTDYNDVLEVDPENENGKRVERYEHFHVVLPRKFVKREELIGVALSDARANKEVLKRSLEEITPDAVDTVLDLIAQNGLYRGAEHKAIVETLQRLQAEYASIPDTQKDNYCWVTSAKMQGASKIRNQVIGTLLVDISEEVDLEVAVKKFETKVAPANYQRPNAVITKKMVEKAKKEIDDLGFTDSLGRRCAEIEDITVNNVLFANKGARKAMSANPLDELAESIPEKTKKMDRVDEISIEDFIANVLPGATSIELMPEGRHASNFVSLVAPEDKNAPSMFKWPSPFSWSYAGDAADSIREKVRKAGGSVTGILRCSLAWHNTDDLDIHVVEPGGNEIFYGRKESMTGGNLDVDMNISGETREPVENITWPDERRMREGEYTVFVHQFRKRETVDFGFEAEIEYNGEVKSFSYASLLRTGRSVEVARFKWSARDGLTYISSLDGTERSREIWGINTNNFHNVSIAMLSPNHWDGAGVGNKHYFFMLEGCANPDSTRGFYNEFLKDELKPHKRVFEALGAKMTAPPVPGQLCGLGFSSTQRNEILCRVHGKFERTVKITF